MPSSTNPQPIDLENRRVLVVEEAGTLRARRDDDASTQNLDHQLFVIARALGVSGCPHNCLRRRE